MYIVMNLGLLSCSSKHSVQRRVPQGLAMAIGTHLIQYFSTQEDKSD